MKDITPNESQLASVIAKWLFTVNPVIWEMYLEEFKEYFQKEKINEH